MQLLAQGDGTSSIGNGTSVNSNDVYGNNWVFIEPGEMEPRITDFGGEDLTGGGNLKSYIETPKLGSGNGSASCLVAPSLVGEIKRRLRTLWDAKGLESEDKRTPLLITRFVFECYKGIVVRYKQVRQGLPGGNATEYRSSQQWDAPHSWAPLEYAAAYSFPSSSEFVSSVCLQLDDTIKGGVFAALSSQSHDDMVKMLFYAPGHLDNSMATGNGTKNIRNLYTTSAVPPKASSIGSDPLYGPMFNRMVRYLSMITHLSTKPGTSVDRVSDDYIFLEKYDSSSAGGGGGGEYATQQGFGWINSVTQNFLAAISDTSLMSSEIIVPSGVV